MRPFIHACAHSFNFYHRSCSRRRSRASPALWHDAQPISLDWPCLLLAARERRSTSMGSTKSPSSTDAGRLAMLLRLTPSPPGASAIETPPPLIRRCPFDQTTMQREWWPPPPATRATETVSTVRKSILREAFAFRYRYTSCHT